jgi:UDP-3-O-[3-hydroxymyristoyl] N-acetylglucosamine deacetylase|tara:strand:- start:52 stop:975 length:924 start_codon:yes stop_codon:yes gene_type:complete
MNNLNQKTILEAVTFEGVGLHTGLNTKVKLLPAEDSQGIVFKRIDLKNNNTIKANFKNVSSAKLCTTLKNDFGATVSTVEHLMAAFYITGIDNIVVELNNSELPIMDGSSKEFITLIEKSGLKKQFSKRKYLKILKEINYKDNEKSISVKPNSNFEVEFELAYNNIVIGNQKNKVNFTDHDLKDIYTSRTFCLYEDIEKIKECGLAKGGSLENAIVVKGDKILNEGGLRNSKEFVNHKILDLAGDFMLSGYRMLGSINCIQGGHYLSTTFLKEIFKDKSNFEELILDNVDLPTRNLKTQANKLAVNA